MSDSSPDRLRLASGTALYASEEEARIAAGHKWRCNGAGSLRRRKLPRPLGWVAAIALLWSTGVADAAPHRRKRAPDSSWVSDCVHERTGPDGDTVYALHVLSGILAKRVGKNVRR